MNVAGTFPPQPPPMTDRRLDATLAHLLDDDGVGVGERALARRATSKIARSARAL